jgi:hypothetical protein
LQVVPGAHWKLNKTLLLHFVNALVPLHFMVPEVHVGVTTGKSQMGRLAATMRHTVPLPQVDGTHLPLLQVMILVVPLHCLAPFVHTARVRQTGLLGSGRKQADPDGHLTCSHWPLTHFMTFFETEEHRWVPEVQVAADATATKAKKRVDFIMLNVEISNTPAFIGEEVAMSYFLTNL